MVQVFVCWNPLPRSGLDFEPNPEPTLEFGNVANTTPTYITIAITNIPTKYMYNCYYIHSNLPECQIVNSVYIHTDKNLVDILMKAHNKQKHMKYTNENGLW